MSKKDEKTEESATAEMLGPKTKVLEVAPEQLIKAAWNYKLPGTEEDWKKLTESIKHDGSAGVLAVREIPKDEGGPLTLPDGRTVYETMDGNHRLDQVLSLGWKKIPVENFGVLKRTEAILIARRRNHSWFEDDKVALAKLISDDVVNNGEYTVEDLALFMPDSEQDLRALVGMVEVHDWKDEDGASLEPQTAEASSEFTKIQVVMHKDAYAVYQQAYEQVRMMLESENLKLNTNESLAHGQVVEALSAEFLAGGVNVPEDTEDMPEGDEFSTVHLNGNGTSHPAEVGR